MKFVARPPLERLARIDCEIRKGDRPNASTLAEILEVHPRTIHRDVEFLRDRLHAPVQYDAQRFGYYYADPSFALPLVRITDGECVALFLAEPENPGRNRRQPHPHRPAQPLPGNQTLGPLLRQKLPGARPRRPPQTGGDGTARDTGHVPRGKSPMMMTPVRRRRSTTKPRVASPRATLGWSDEEIYP